MMGTARAAATARERPARRGAGGGVAPVLAVRWLGRVPYSDALELQQRLVAERRAAAIGDQLLLLEHDHVITLGTSASAGHVLVGPDERRLLGIELFETGRGGDVTYHGPGQLVGYPILALEPERRDLHRYVRDLEEALILALVELGIAAGRVNGLTGVWVNGRKIAAIGVRVSSGWITSHGFALNVATDLSFFDAIVPCGIRGRAVTSIESEVGRTAALQDVGDLVAAKLGVVFGRALLRTN